MLGDTRITGVSFNRTVVKGKIMKDTEERCEKCGHEMVWDGKAGLHIKEYKKHVAIGTMCFERNCKCPKATIQKRSRRVV